MVTIQNRPFCFEAPAQPSLLLLRSGERKSCLILVPSALDVSSLPDRLCRIEFQFHWVLGPSGSQERYKRRAKSQEEAIQGTNTQLLCLGFAGYVALKSSNSPWILFLLNKDKKVNYYLITVVCLTGRFLSKGRIIFEN